MPFPHAARSATSRSPSILGSGSSRTRFRRAPRVGAPYSATLEAQLVTNLNPPTGSTPGPLTWSIVPGSGALPPGLTLANGVISGTPTTEGTYSSRSRRHRRVAQALTDVLADGSAAAEGHGREAVRDGAPSDAVGGRSSVQRQAHAFRRERRRTRSRSQRDRCPPGLALAADGTVAGNPARRRRLRATLRLSDNEGRTTDYAANFGVAARLAVSTLALRPGKVGRLYRAKVASTGGVLPRKWKILKGPLPKGVRFDPALGILSGTPTKAGRYRVTFQVTDGLKVVAKKTLRIDILDA